MYADARLRPWVDALHAAVPDLDPFDAHLHVGLKDPAGFQATAEEVVDAVAAVRSGGFVFALKDPDGYAGPNAAMAALAGDHPGLRALARLDPADDPLGEARRALDAGAVGLKLHPRGEAFRLDDERLDPVFALAAERRLPVMVHAGAGDPLATTLALDRAAAHPEARVMLAHCGIGAFATAIERAHELDNVFFDTAWWNPSDVWALLRLAPPGRVLFASDVPFAGPGLCQLLTGRLALQSGLDADAVRAIMGGTARTLAAHGDLPPRGTPPAQTTALPPELERLYVTLCSVVEPMLRGDPPGQGLELAVATCEDARGPHVDVFRSVADLLGMAAEEEEGDPLRPLRTPGFDLVLAAAILARTPDVPLP